MDILDSLLRANNEKAIVFVKRDRYVSLKGSILGNVDDYAYVNLVI